MADSLDQRLKKIDEDVQKYKRNYQIPEFRANNDAEKYWNQTQDKLKSMSAEECGEASVLLSQQAAYIQTLYNKEKRTVDWANSNIDFIIADEVGQYQLYSKEERRAIAIKHNESATKLQQIKVQSQVCVDELEFLPTKIRDMAEMYKNLQMTKRKINQ